MHLQLKSCFDVYRLKEKHGTRFGCMVASRGGYRMARGWHYAKLSLSNAPRLSFSGMCILLFLFLSLCRFCLFVFFFCSHWSLVDVPSCSLPSCSLPFPQSASSRFFAAPYRTSSSATTYRQSTTRLHWSSSSTRSSSSSKQLTGYDRHFVIVRTWKKVIILCYSILY